MVATADLLVYNAEKILSLFFLYFSFFNQVTSIFHLRGGEIKQKVFLGLPRVHGPRPWLWCCFDYFHYDFGWLERTRRLLDLLFQYVPKNNLRIVQQHVLKHTRCIAQKSAVGWVCKSVHRGLLFWSFPSPLASFLSTTAWSTTSSPYIGHGHYNPGGQDVGATILLFRFWSSYSSPSRCPWLSRRSTSFWRSAFPTGLQPNSHLIWSVREYIFHPIFWSNLLF